MKKQTDFLKLTVIDMGNEEYGALYYKAKDGTIVVKILRNFPFSIFYEIFL